jgi:hypothetical protein
LTDCLSSNGDLKARFNTSLTDLAQCNNDKSSLKSKINELNQKLEKSDKKLTLTELLQQVCEKYKPVARPRGSRPSQDDRLRQQDFYKRVNWTTFCQGLNLFLNPVE